MRPTAPFTPIRRRLRRRLVPIVLAAPIVLAPFAALGQDATPAVGSPPAAGPVAVVAAGLVNPRGLAFGSDGALLVAIAGASGPTAGVAAIDGGCPRLLAGGLPSYRVVFNGPVGVADVADDDGRLYALLAGGNIDGDGPPNGLYRVGPDGGVELVADASGFIRDNPVADRPRDYDTDGQPYALLPMGDAFWVTEGNSNQLLRLGLDGSVSRVADLSRGHPIPTGIAPAPDGGAYVAYFTHIPYEDGAGKVVHVAPDGGVTDAWTGLTLPTALAVGADGALYALEMATGIDPADERSIRPGTGRVVRQSGPAASEVVATGLPLPVAMDFGPDGALYVAGPAFGADEGEGTVLRLDLAAGEPIAVPSPLPAGPSCPAGGA